jgi:hypothetical protein
MRMVHPLILDRLDAQVLNVSRDGLLLRTLVFAQVGTVIQIRLKTKFVLGEVRHCTPVGNIFHVGVQILDSKRTRVGNGSGSDQ